LPGSPPGAGRAARLSLQLLAAQCSARTFAGGFAVGPHRAAINKDMLDTRRWSGRHFKGRTIADGLRIEDGDVGAGARYQNAATGRTKRVSRQAGHPTHRFFEAE